MSQSGEEDNGVDDYVYESDDAQSDTDVSPRFNSSTATTTTNLTHASLSGSSSVNNSNNVFTVLTQQAIKLEQDRLIGEISELFSLSNFEARRLLMEMRWNKEELTNSMFNHGTDALLKSAGVLRIPAAFFEIPDSCIICAEDMAAEIRLTNTTCGHSFCRECWTTHIRMGIQENASVRLRCMMDKCKAVISPSVMQKIPLEQQDIDRYERSMLDSFVEVNPRVKWCPSQPCCGRAIRVSDTSTTRIDCECTCEEVFCFSCDEASHSPSPCEWAKQWKRLCKDESANALYIAKNCKPCPKCGKNIFKQDGCNHVTCPCGQSMCWLCGAATGRAHDWSSIQGHTCGKFRLQVETSAATARMKLDQYIYYFEKYDGHMQSLRLANAVKTKVDKSIVELEGTLDNKNLADWLWIGLYQLLRMRRFCAWTYAFAYYAFYDRNFEKLKAAARLQTSSSSSGVLHVQELFEDLQGVLQNSVERLSKLVEMPAGEMIPNTTKIEVLNLCSATHKNALALNDFVINDLFGNGNLGLDDPPAYFPIRRMVTGLGVTGSIGPSSSPRYSNCKSALVVAPVRAVASSSRKSPYASRQSSQLSHKSASSELIDLTIDDEADAMIVDGDILEVDPPLRRNKQQRVP